MTESQTLKSFQHLHMEREKLLSSTNKYKRALESQVEGLKEDATRFALKGLIFGGVALGTFLLVRAFQKNPKKAEKESKSLPAPTTFASTLFASIQGYIVSFLLSVAREKITSYLEAYLAKQNETAPNDRA